MANNNGNATLFFSSLFTFLAPNYKIVNGKNLATSFYFSYILIGLCILYFTAQGSAKYNRQYRRHDNETHYSGVTTGAILGFLIRRRIMKSM